MEEKTVYQALALVQSKLGNLSKNKKGHGYKYLDLPSILEASSGPLAEVNACVFDTIEKMEDGQMFCVTTFYANGGQISVKNPFVYESSLRGNNDIQKIGSATTYLRRYNRQNLYDLSGEDDDGVKAEGLDSKKPEKSPEKKLSKAEMIKKIDAWIIRQSDKRCVDFRVYLKENFKNDNLDELSEESLKQIIKILR